MIAVISDDFTGGAEIAGLGLRYGMRVVLQTDDFNRNDMEDADILIIATDTRSMVEAEAYKTMHNLKSKLKKYNYQWLFKKTDSVFRGHILKELIALLDASNKTRALLVNSNPQIGRKIIDGIYYINDQLLSETEFARDPDFSISTSDVLELLGTEKHVNIHLFKPGEDIESDGIFLGEAGYLGDLKKFAQKVNDGILPAGSSGFFSALLEAKGYRIINDAGGKATENDKKHLIVLGSANPDGKISHAEAQGKDIGISFMPEEIFYNRPSSPEVMDRWIDEVIALFGKHKKVIIEISHPIVPDKAVSKRLKEQIAFLVKSVFERIDIQELVIDGGATAYAVASSLHLEKFYPDHEIAPGIVRMKVDKYPDLCLTIKPGSYPMPRMILDI